MKKRLGNIADIIFLTIVYFMTMSKTAYAYVDPSVITYAIQAGAGIVIAVGATVGVYFRRTKRKLSKKMKLDQAKEIESDEIIDKNDTEGE